MDVLRFLLTGLSLLLMAVTWLPETQQPHWLFRAGDYVRLQATVVLVVLAALSIWFAPTNGWGVALSAALGYTVVYNLAIIAPYLGSNTKQHAGPNSIKVLSVNVMQENTCYQALLDYIAQESPDVLLTLETNQDWEAALAPLSDTYPHQHRMAQENRYGMHLFSRLPLHQATTHYLVSEEIPSVEALLEAPDGHRFVFWGIHPPPPSPTEQPTARKKNAELMEVALRSALSKHPCLVVGDFNNVCWSRATRLFAHISGLTDARLRRGVWGTFPARWRWMRFPIDLLFHDPVFSLEAFKTGPYFGSDHLPLVACLSLQSPEAKAQPNLAQQHRARLEEMRQQGQKAVTEEPAA